LGGTLGVVVTAIRVLVVDDHELLAQSLVRLLEDDPDLRIIGTEVTAAAGIERAIAERPDVVVMDYLLPDMDGAAATRLLKAELADIHVIMLSGSDKPGTYTAAMEAGCEAWVRKTRAAHDLFDAIHRVAAGERVPSEEYEELPPLSELVVHYQPVVGLIDRVVVGFEALVRWQHPREGILLPARFLPLAEMTGYITDIDRQVTVQALHDLATWQQTTSHESALWVSVNMSAARLSGHDVASQMAEVVMGAEVDPSNLVVEITETALLEDTPEVIESMGRLKDVGFRLALDDFGTAFSSLAYLRRFPFDHVKIDTSFTAELPHNARAVRLIESIRRLADSMGATGIAEGIERQDQAACLIAAGWAFGQGYLYSRPLPFDQASRVAASRTLG
jgi:EAL domain-containing protein (putative c-di-GMP-specific phosphodiesterase class I)